MNENKVHYYYAAESNRFMGCSCGLDPGCREKASREPVQVSAFIDESERGQTHYFTGAIVAADPQVHQISQTMDAIMEDFSQHFPSLTLQTEFHGSEMMNGRGPWKNVPIRAKFAMFRKVFTAVQQAGGRVFVEGIAYSELQPAANRKLSPRDRALSHLSEQIDHYGTRDNLLKVIADDHHTAETSRSNFARYRIVGTYGYKPSKLEGIDLNLQFVDSRTSRLLQASDMVTYMYNRLQTVSERDARAALEKERLWSIFEHSPYRPSEGRGRIWAPPRTKPPFNNGG